MNRHHIGHDFFVFGSGIILVYHNREKIMGWFLEGDLNINFPLVVKYSLNFIIFKTCNFCLVFSLLCELFFKGWHISETQLWMHLKREMWETVLRQGWQLPSPAERKSSPKQILKSRNWLEALQVSKSRLTSQALPRLMLCYLFRIQVKYILTGNFTALMGAPLLLHSSSFYPYTQSALSL